VKRRLITAVLACFAAGPVLAADDHRVLEQRMLQRLALDPADSDARFNLARSLAWQGRYAEAEAEFLRLLESAPENADYLLGLAQVRLWSGSAEKSLPLLDKARRLKPDYEDVWRVQIQALLALGDTQHLDQARLTRNAARLRFPHRDWTYAPLDRTESAAGVVPAAPSDRNTWEVGMSHESLTRGLPNWTSRYVLGQWTVDEKTNLYGGWRETERYALADRELHLGGAFPLGSSLQIQLEAGFSDSHRVLPERYGLAGLQFQPAAGWSLGAGFRRSVYPLGLSKVIQFNVDRYTGNEQFGYTLYLGGPDGSGLSSSHRWQWTHLYSERDSIGISLNSGRETENTGATGFLTTPVSGVALSGRHRFAPDWALVWELSSLRQGDRYTRNGVRLGLRRHF